MSPARRGVNQGRRRYSARVLGPLGHLGSALAYAARRGDRRRRDEAAVADAAWARASMPGVLPAGLELTWLGTSGFRLAYQGHDVLIDPYLTRIPFADLARRRCVVPRYDAIAAHVPRASAILIGHTHFDHAMDAPVIAGALGCPVYGSRSMVQLMGLHGQHALGIEVEAHRRYQIGPFAVTFVPSVHSRLALGLWTPSDGELTCEHLDELTPQRYRCGQVWGIHVAVAGITLYHQGSCDLLEDEMRHGDVDVLLAGIAGRRFTRRYVARLIGRLRPNLIVPHHYDDFFRPLDAPMGFSLNVNVESFLHEVHAADHDTAVRTLAIGEVMR